MKSVHGGELELVALEIRGALDEIGELSGVVFTDDLLDRIFARIAVAAMDLDRQEVGFQPPLAGPALDDGGQDFQQQMCLVAGLGIRRRRSIGRR